MSQSPENSLNLSNSWVEIKDRLREEIGHIDYQQWILPVGFGQIEDGELTLYVPTRFHRDQMQKRQFAGRILSLWQQADSEIQRINYQVKEDSVLPSNEEVLAPSSDANDYPVASKSSKKFSAFGSTLNSKFTFESFVVGKTNEFAYACAKRVADRPASSGFNPLFFYGGVGLGKTHLMHAIGAEILAKGEHTVAYLSAEQFLDKFIDAIQAGKTDRSATQKLKAQWRSVDVLMIDDVQFFLGKTGVQEEFFNTFNYLMDHGSQIIVSADKGPAELPKIDPRIASRLGSGMVADLHAANTELRYSILKSKAESLGVNVPDKVLEFLAQKITSSVRELEGALNRLVSHASMFEQPITLQSTQEILKDLLRAHNRKMTIDEIKKKVAEHWNIRVSEMTSSRRTLVVSRPRQVAMYLAKELTEKSLPDIGKEFKRDHTTVMHAINVVQKLIITDPSFAESVELVRRLLET